MKHLLFLAYRNTKRYYRQSLAAILSVAAAFSTVVLFDGYMHDVSLMYDDGYRFRGMIGDIVVEHIEAQSKKGKTDPWSTMIEADQQKVILDYLQKSSKVELTLKNFSFNGMISNGLISTIFFGRAYEVENGRKFRRKWEWDTLYGVPFHLSPPDSILIGQGLGVILSCEPEKKIWVTKAEGGYIPEERSFTCRESSVQVSSNTEGGTMNALSLNVTGLVDAGYQDLDNKHVLMSLENAQVLMNTDKISFISVLLKENESVKDFLKEFNHYLESKNIPVRGVFWQDHPSGEMYTKTMSLLKVFRNFVSVVIIGISFLSILNTFVKLVKERTREIGLLLSLGFYRRHIVQLFSFEAIFLTAMGLAVGLVTSIVLTLLINVSGLHYRGGILSEPVLFMITMQVKTIVIAFIVLSVLAILTSWLSLRQTLKMKVVECLGHV